MSLLNFLTFNDSTQQLFFFPSSIWEKQEWDFEKKIGVKTACMDSNDVTRIWNELNANTEASSNLPTI